LDREKVRRNRVVTFLTDGELEVLKTMAEAEKETLSGACYQLLKNQLSIARGGLSDRGKESNEKQ